MASEDGTLTSHPSTFHQFPSKVENSRPAEIELRIFYFGVRKPSRNFGQDLSLLLSSLLFGKIASSKMSGKNQYNVLVDMEEGGGYSQVSEDGQWNG